MREIEKRGLDGTVEIRAREGKGKAVAGYAAVFDSLSEDLGGFREVIKPGAFDRALNEGADVRALVNHEPGAIIGRQKAGTLRLAVDARGLRYEVDLPDTNTGRDLLESISRGDISGSSFSFRIAKGGEAWQRNEDGTSVREVRDLELIDVSPVTFPAYLATHVSKRALEEARETAVPPPPAPAPVPPLDRLAAERDYLDRLRS